MPRSSAITRFRAIDVVLQQRGRRPANALVHEREEKERGIVDPLTELVALGSVGHPLTLAAESGELSRSAAMTRIE